MSGGLTHVKKIVSLLIAVTFWLDELRVGRGETATVQLSERNAWMTGIDEKWTPGPQPPRRPAR